jgi:hypothetical protein
MNDYQQLLAQGTESLARYERTGSRDDLERALADYQLAPKAAQGTLRSPDVVAAVVANLLCERLVRFTCASAAAQAAAAVVASIAALPAADLIRVRTLPELTAALIGRYDQDGAPAFLALALDAARIETTVPDVSRERRSRALQVLGNVLFTCTSATGDRRYVDEGLAAHQQAGQVSARGLTTRS